MGKKSLKKRNLKIVLEYDGSFFFGFQRQPHHPTIHEALEKALSSLFNQTTKIKAASGRTDTGVHAEHQVVNFYTTSGMDAAQIQKGLNALLPRPIAVKEACEVTSDYHARYSARSKVYEYRIWNHAIRSPLRSSWSHHVPERLDLKRLKQGVCVLKGRHDFRSFCSANGKAKITRTVRTIKRFEVLRDGSLITLRVEADGFLHHMVRNMVGSLVQLGQGKIEAKDMRKILASRDRRKAGPSAPSVGLSLVSVTY